MAREVLLVHAQDTGSSRQTPRWAGLVSQDKRLVIGRGRHCDVVLDSGRCSREHLYVTFDGAQHVVEDSGSTGGTWLNREKIRRAVITDGMSLFGMADGVSFSLVPVATYVLEATRVLEWPTMPLLTHLPSGLPPDRVEALYRRTAEADPTLTVVLARSLSLEYAQAFAASLRQTEPVAVLAQHCLDGTAEGVARLGALAERWSRLCRPSPSAEEEERLRRSARRDRLAMEVAALLAGLVGGAVGERLSALVQAR